MATMEVGRRFDSHEFEEVRGLCPLMQDFGIATLPRWSTDDHVEHVLGETITDGERMAAAVEAGIYHRANGERPEGQEIPEGKLARFQALTASLTARDVSTVKMLIATALETLHPDTHRNQRFIDTYYPDSPFATED